MLGLLASLVGALLGWTAQHGLFYLLRDAGAGDSPAASGPPQPVWPRVWGCAALPFRHWQDWVAYHHCGYCAATCYRCHRQRLAGVRHGDPGPRPDHVAAAELDLKITLALLGGGLLATLVLGGLLLLGLKGYASPACRRFAELAAGAGSAAAASACSGGTGACLRPDPVGHGADRPVARRAARHRQDQLPDDAPNHFVLNVLPAERMPRRANRRTPAMPRRCIRWCRADSVAINGEPVRQLVSKESWANARFVAISARPRRPTCPSDNHLWLASGGMSGRGGAARRVRRGRTGRKPSAEARRPAELHPGG